MRLLLRGLLWHVMPLNWVAAAIGAAGALLGSAKSASASVGHSKYQMDYQRDLANTAHVRQMQDLANAGINPILTAKFGGAGNVSAPGAQIPDYGQSVSRGIQAYQARETSKLQRQQTDATRAQAGLTREKEHTERAIQTEILQRAGLTNAQKFLAMQQFLKEEHLTEAERLKLAERLAEHDWWTSARQAGKAAPAAKAGLNALQMLKQLLKGK